MFSIVIKINTAAKASAAVAVCRGAELLYLYPMGINTPLFHWGTKPAANKTSQSFESFSRMVIIYRTVWMYPCSDT